MFCVRIHYLLIIRERQSSLDRGPFVNKTILLRLSHRLRNEMAPLSLTTQFDVRTFFLTILIGGMISILIIVMRYNSCDDNDMPRTSKRRCIARAKTGDLVGVSYNSKRGRLVRVFTGSLWIHVGMVVRTQSGCAYVLEAARYSRANAGIIAKPLSEWLDYNEGNYIAWRHYTGQGIDSGRLRALLEHTKNADVNLFVVDWLKTMYKTTYTSQVRKRDKYYCSEFVAFALQECGVLRKLHDPAGYKPWELLYGNIAYNGGHSYANPSLITIASSH